MQKETSTCLLVATVRTELKYLGGFDFHERIDHFWESVISSVNSEALCEREAGDFKQCGLLKQIWNSHILIYYPLPQARIGERTSRLPVIKYLRGTG